MKVLSVRSVVTLVVVIAVVGMTIAWTAAFCIRDLLVKKQGAGEIYPRIELQSQ